MKNFTNKEKSVIYLSHLNGMTNTRLKKLIEVYPNLYEIFSLSEKELDSLKDIFKNKYDDFRKGVFGADLDDFMEELEDKHIEITTYFSSDYPVRLKNLSDPPLVLYYVGDLSLANKKGIAIVGTRRPSNYGEFVTTSFAKDLAEYGYNIVSGLADGVDALAHKGALAVGGNTIAVLGGGFDHMYPPSNTKLARDIAKKGLILTEYYPSVKPTAYTFPTRNRIIAGLSDAVLLTEAGEKSGSLYTREAGDELGLDIFAIPGNINSKNSVATNRLIKNGSAFFVTSPEDILIRLGKDKNLQISNKKDDLVKKIDKSKFTEEQVIIIEILEKSECDYDSLQEISGFAVPSLNMHLMTLELGGVIKKLAGNVYILC